MHTTYKTPKKNESRSHLPALSRYTAVCIDIIYTDRIRNVPMYGAVGVPFNISFYVTSRGLVLIIGLSWI